MSLLTRVAPVLRVAARVAGRSGRVLASRSLSTARVTQQAGSATSFQVDNPYTGEIIAEVPLINETQATKLIEAAEASFQGWRGVPLAQRIQLVEKWCEVLAAEKETVALSVTQQMGKPIGQARGEVDTCIKRARALIAMSTDVLSEEAVLPLGDPNSALLRKITKEPIGVVLALCPWNYPLLCSVNTVVAAVLAGNSVLLKHSERTPLVAAMFEGTFLKAGAPKGLVQSLDADHALVAKIVEHPSIAFVQFTGSVSGGRAVYSATAAKRFIDVGLELGGKDPAYVAADADLPYAIENVVDGGMYNAGQSCCAVERVYVHERNYDAFLTGASKIISSYVLGDPTAASTSMGPIAQAKHVAFLSGQVEEARSLGARVLVGGAATKDAAGKGRFFQPTLIADASHKMRIVSEESFGPVLAVMKVKDDAEAIRLMNDSAYGLTASVWTADLDRASRIGSQLNTGTVFMNRCDFLDPYLAWSGRRDSGKGIGLSTHGFAPFFRTKSWNFRPSTK